VGDHDAGHDALIVAEEEEARRADGGDGCDEDGAMEEGDACFRQHIEDSFPFDTDHKENFFLDCERTKDRELKTRRKERRFARQRNKRAVNWDLHCRVFTSYGVDLLPAILLSAVFLLRKTADYILHSEGMTECQTEHLIGIRSP